MAYIPTKWENEPSTKTPLNAENLNKLEQGVKALHDAMDSGELKGDKGDKGDPGVFDVNNLTEDDIAALKLKLGIS